MADNTPAKHLEPYKWQPGQSANPAGRPKGARNKLGEAFIEALKDDFIEHGVKAIETVRQDKPDQYLRVIASLMPKDINLTVNEAEDLTDDDIRERIRTLTNRLAPFLGGTSDAGAGANAAGSPTEPLKLH